MVVKGAGGRGFLHIWAGNFICWSFIISKVFVSVFFKISYSCQGDKFNLLIVVVAGFAFCVAYIEESFEEWRHHITDYFVNLILVTF